MIYRGSLKHQQEKNVKRFEMLQYNIISWWLNVVEKQITSLKGRGTLLIFIALVAVLRDVTSEILQISPQKVAGIMYMRYIYIYIYIRVYIIINLSFHIHSYQ